MPLPPFAYVLLAEITIPGQPPSYVKPVGSTSPKYFEWLESNSHIVYPALAVVVLALLIGGILQAWRTQDLDGLAKAELKREIVLELRRQIAGVSAEALSKVVGLEPFKLVKILEEMQRDGIIDNHTTSHRLTVWQIVGVGPARRVRS